MTDERKNLAKKVKSYRKEHHLSQLEFAEECGISDVSLCRIERQNSNVSLETIQLLAARIGDTVAELLSDPAEAQATHFPKPSPEDNHHLYCLIPTEICINERKTTTYGIGVVKNMLMLNYILDISEDYNKILSLVERCNTEKLDPIHLRDVVENILIE